MFGYYLKLALHSFKRNKALTALMVLAIALGIGASMTTLTVFHVLSGDPIPQKSERLFYVQMDPASINGFKPGEDPERQMTRFDSEALLRDARGTRQAFMTRGGLAIEPNRGDMQAMQQDARFTTADFFPMFDVPFRYGHGWSKTEDDSRARVAVISTTLNDKLYGGGNSVGKTISLDQHEFRVIGVLAPWSPKPRFFDITGSRFGGSEEVYLPMGTSRALKMSTSGDMNCWDSAKNANDDPEGNGGVNAPCAWLQYWVELDNPAKAADFRQYLTNYSDQQRAAGRFVRPTNVALSNVMTWLDKNNVVPGDVRLQLWLALGFLLVCLLNTVGLLLAKFLRRGGEIGVRRALGASRRQVFQQCLVEAGMVGLAGGVLGLALAFLGLWAVRQQPTDYAPLAHLDAPMLLLTFALALLASVLAGLLPAWRACQISPAIQLKSQ
ncbi:MAG: ABC transporter permease [Thermomonas sp.]